MNEAKTHKLKIPVKKIKNTSEKSTEKKVNSYRARCICQNSGKCFYCYREKMNLPIEDNVTAKKESKTAKNIIKKESPSDLFLNPKEILPLHWQVVNSLRGRPDWLVQHCIDSANYCIMHLIPNFLSQFETIIDGSASGGSVWNVKFTNPYFVRPHRTEMGVAHPLYPIDAFNMGLTYSSQLYCDIVISRQTKKGDEPKITIHEKHHIGDVPEMIGSCNCNTRYETDRAKISECEMLRGGYFIINGKEKVLICQEKLAPNRIYVFSGSDGILTAEIRSVPLSIVKAQSMLSLIIKSNQIYIRMSAFTVDIPLFIFLRALGMKDAQACSSIVGINYTDTEDMTEDVAEISAPIEAFIIRSIEETSAIKNQKMAIEFLMDHIKSENEKKSSSKKSQLVYIIKDVFLPHVGMTKNHMMEKAHFVCTMVRKLILTMLGFRSKDNRDSFANKRIDIPGTLMFGRIKASFLLLQNKIRKGLLNAIKEKERKNIDILRFFSQLDFTKKVMSAYETGKWSDRGENYSNVCQQMSRMSFISAISDLRQVQIPTGGEGRLTNQRVLDPSQWGLMCAGETPEGPSVGLHKKMALACRFSLGNQADAIIDIVNNMPRFIPITKCMKDNSTEEPASAPPSAVSMLSIQSNTSNINNEIWELYLDHRYYIKVYVNGKWIGVVARETTVEINGQEFNERTAHAFLLELKKYKQDGRLPYDASIFHNHYEYELHIVVDTGRAQRPLLVVKNNKVLLTSEKMAKIIAEYPPPQVMSELISQGYIEILDKNEEEFCLIALTPADLNKKFMTTISDKTLEGNYNYTHCEIHPSLILGVAASTVAFADHDQAPRIIYQSAMGKQAMGMPCLNFRQRIGDNLLNILHYPQKPIVQSRLLRMIKTSLNTVDKDDGQEYDGSGQQAIVAFLCDDSYNIEDAVIMNQSSVELGFANSDCYKTRIVECHDGETFGNKECKAKYIDEKGFPAVGTLLKNKDPFVGRYHEIQNKTGDSKKLKDSSECIKTKEFNRVCGVSRMTGKHDGIAVKTYSVRIPEIGDKFAAAHAQKGVIALLRRREDMPFTISGMVPDIIMNPNCVPSRMTMGHVLEMLLGKACAMEGKIGDGTAFESRDPRMVEKEIGDILKKNGYHRYGEERLIDGRTGEMMKATIFMGICNYQRLKHMVVDKVHARSQGNIEILTHQPTEGRSRDGGLRIGEMERDALISHGLSGYVLERLCTLSDATPVKICPNCKIPFTNKIIKTLDKLQIRQLEDEALKRGVEPDYRRIREKICEICRICGSSMKTVTMPFAFKLVTQEVMAMGIKLNLDTE